MPLQEFVAPLQKETADLQNLRLLSAPGIQVAVGGPVGLRAVVEMRVVEMPAAVGRVAVEPAVAGQLEVREHQVLAKRFYIPGTEISFQQHLRASPSLDRISGT